VKGLWRSTGNRGLARWRLTHRGPLTSGPAEAGGFARSEPGLTAPNLQWQVLPVGYRDHGRADPARRAMTVLTGLVDVASRGRVRLASRDPRHRPLVDPGYVSDVRDLTALAAGVRLAREFGAAAPLARICAAELSPATACRATTRSATSSGRRWPAATRRPAPAPWAVTVPGPAAATPA
jgi:choline dehydrogenase